MKISRGMRAVLAAVGVSAVAAAAVFCVRMVGEAGRGVSTAYSGRVVIGTETWPGYLPLYVARDKGFFADEGVQVDVRRYLSLAELSKDYLAGKMQGRANLTLDAVREASEGLNHRIVLVIDYSNGADAIVARRGIESVGALKGRRVAYEPGTLEEFFLSWALAGVDLRLSDVTAVPGDPSQSASRLADGDADAAVSHEPFITDLSASGDNRVLLSSADAPGLITDVLSFRKEFIDRHPDTVAAITRAYFRAVEYWKDNPEEADAIVAREFGTTPQNIALQMHGLTLLDQNDNVEAMTSATGLGTLYANLRSVGTFVARQDGMTAIDTDLLVEPKFISATLHP